MNSKYAKLLITLMLALLFCLPASGMAATSDEAIQVNPRYSHPVVEGVMYVTEDETVTIEGNPSVLKQTLRLCISGCLAPMTKSVSL